MKKLVLLLAWVSLAGGIHLSAQTLTLDSPSLNQTSISTSGLDGYIFFSPTTGSGGSYPDLYSVPSYVSLGTYSSSVSTPTFAPNSGTANGSNRYSGGGGYTSLSINSTSYYTGIDYSNHIANSSSSLITLGTISLLSGTPSNLTLGFLLDTTGGGSQYDENVTLSLENSGTVLQTVTLESSTPSTKANDFYYATLSSANLAYQAGDTLVVQAYNVSSGTQDTEIAGLTFATSSVPEPSTWALLISGLALLAFHLKRRGAVFSA